MARRRGCYAPRPDVMLINPTDYSLYLPLLPKVTAGILDARRVCVPLAVLELAVWIVLTRRY